MIIPTALQIKLLDEATIKTQNIRSIDLMERAAKSITNYLLIHNSHFNNFIINCGTGNNGGDGLCIARHLLQAGKKVRVNICGPITSASKDFTVNFRRLQKQFPETIFIIQFENEITHFNCDCLIDAIFGTGLNKPVTGLLAQIINKMNTAEAIILAVDIPSGLQADIASKGEIVKADITISFEYPKLAFLFPENEAYVGDWFVLPIGLTTPEIADIIPQYQFISSEDISASLHPRNTFNHKGTFGHSLIIGGNLGMEGAAILSGSAALRTGSGLVTITSTAVTFEHPELMSISFEDISTSITQKKINAIGIGPGLGKSENAKNILWHLINNITSPLVIDADALNILAENINWLEMLPNNSILTPHPKEFERLFGAYNEWQELPEKMRALSIQFQIFIVFKRAYTIISTPSGEIFFNASGNAGMATAGSGDVLTGIITGLLAQQFSSRDAVITGVYMHGLAGDLAMQETNGINLVAGDIIQQIPSAQSILLTEK